MTIQDIGLFQAIGAKMDYLNQRQSIIAQNVANSDTPGYRPQDLVDVNFADMLREQTQSSNGVPAVRQVSIAATDNGHIGGVNESANVRSAKSREPYEVAPAGNAVIMEEQLIKAGQNAMDYNLMLSVLQKEVGMIRTALGNR